jgi:hypothetical protein
MMTINDSNQSLRRASHEEQMVQNFISQDTFEHFDESSPRKLQQFADKSRFYRKKPATAVKIKTKTLDKEVVLNDMEILRIYDAKSADIGRGSVLNDASMTSERLASLIFTSTTEGSTGQV